MPYAACSVTGVKPVDGASGVAIGLPWSSTTSSAKQRRPFPVHAGRWSARADSHRRTMQQQTAAATSFICTTARRTATVHDAGQECRAAAPTPSSMTGAPSPPALQRRSLMGAPPPAPPHVSDVGSHVNPLGHDIVASHGVSHCSVAPLPAQIAELHWVSSVHAVPRPPGIVGPGEARCRRSTGPPAPQSLFGAAPRHLIDRACSGRRTTSDDMLQRTSSVCGPLGSVAGITWRNGALWSAANWMPSRNTSTSLIVAVSWDTQLASTSKPAGTVAPLASVVASSGGLLPAIAAAIGVPIPVGPSQPLPALHSEPAHEPLLPATTSLNWLAFTYGYCDVAPAWPVAAKMPATSGLDALVPPIEPHCPFSNTATPVPGSATADTSPVARMLNV